MKRGTEPTAEFPGLPSEVVGKLTEIWQDVLGRRFVGPDENFFEIGGNPAFAIEILDQTRRELGRTMPPLALYTAPTIYSLARTLTDGLPVRFPNAVLLRKGPSASPLFMLHGLGGNVMELFEVAQLIEQRQPIHGLQARGSDNLEEPLDRLEDMAEYHLEAVRAIQSHGPYLLCGHSLGGLVALEIARRLEESGEAVALLSLLDSYPDVRFLAPAQRFQVYLQRAHHRFARIRRSRRRAAIEKPPIPSEKICGSGVVELTKRTLIALRRYRPKPYRGRVRFVRAQIATVFPRDPAIAWADAIPQLEIETVPGDHYGMLTTHARELAAILSRYLGEAAGHGSVRREA